MEAPTSEREVRTLLVCDVVDSTSLVEWLGDDRASELFARVDRAARDALVDHDGREIDKTDGFLMLFAEPVDAVRFAVDLHAALARIGEDLRIPLAMRVGIHTGEVVLRENADADVARGAKPLEVEGLAKPTCARVMALGLGGQTLLTRDAWRSVRGQLGDLACKEHGTYRLKGLADPVEVFEVGDRDRAPMVTPAGAAHHRKRRGLALGLAAGVVATGLLAALALAVVAVLPARTGVPSADGSLPVGARGAQTAWSHLVRGELEDAAQAPSEGPWSALVRATARAGLGEEVEPPDMPSEAPEAARSLAAALCDANALQSHASRFPDDALAPLASVALCHIDADGPATPGLALLRARRLDGEQALAPERELPLLDAAVADVPDNPALRRARARVRMELSRWEEADADLVAAIETDPADARSRGLRLATLAVLERDDDFDDELDALLDPARSAEERRDAAIDGADAKWGMGRVAAAHAILTRAATLAEERGETAAHEDLLLHGAELAADRSMSPLSALSRELAAARAAGVTGTDIDELEAIHLARFGNTAGALEIADTERVRIEVALARGEIEPDALPRPTTCAEHARHVDALVTGGARTEARAALEHVEDWRCRPWGRERAWLAQAHTHRLRLGMADRTELDRLWPMTDPDLPIRQ